MFAKGLKCCLGVKHKEPRLQSRKLSAWGLAHLAAKLAFHLLLLTLLQNRRLRRATDSSEGIFVRFWSYLFESGQGGKGTKRKDLVDEVLFPRGDATSKRYWGGCVEVPPAPLVPVPDPLGLVPLAPVPMLLEPDLSLFLPPQVSEIMSTLVTLKVFSFPVLAEDAEEPVEPADDMLELPPFSHVPFTETSWPT